MKIHNIKKIVLIALFVSIAVILQTIESTFPYFFVPWAKLGLPNIVILFTLIYFGFTEGLLVAFIKSIIGGFLTGTMFNPSFIMSISGGLTSTIAMWLALPLLNKKFTLVTVSVIGALVHIITQFTIVYVIFFDMLSLGKSGLIFTSPWFMFFAIPAGFVTGMAANFVVEYIDRTNLLTKING
ncbi:Gx transporter family protein [Candidatus Desantisbacteria bacterium]|nr:Gx transporter family protein [Candidatus Desantisbacteria bacterium]